MSFIGFIIGVVIFITIDLLCKIMKGDVHDDDLRYAKRLSKDKPPERFKNGYIIYANNTRWFLKNFITWELYWIPFSMGDDLNGLINKSNLEFNSTWLGRNQMFKLVKRIIYTHPNLQAHGIWKLIKFFR